MNAHGFSALRGWLTPTTATAFATLAALSALAACSDQRGADPNAQAAPASAREVLDLSLESDFEISNGNGWALGKPRAVAEADEDQVLVLDSDWKRISVHSATSAELIRTIGNGYGGAAGQFALPVDLTVKDGVAHVLDYEHKRVSQYATNGSFIRDVMLTGAVARTLAHGPRAYWFKLMNPKKGRMLAIADSAGQLRTFVGTLDDHDKAMFNGGNAGALSASSGGDEMLYLNADASRLDWYRDSVITRTLSVLPRTSLSSRARDGRKLSWPLPGRAAVGLASIGDSLVAIVTGELASELEHAEERPELSYWLHIFDLSGRRRASREITVNGMPISVNVGRHSGSIYVSFTNALQSKVVRYEVRPAEIASSGVRQ